MSSISVELLRSALPRVFSAFLGATAVQAFDFGHRGARRPGGNAKACERRLADSCRLLVIGDSTSVGLGAGRFEESVVGRIAQAFPSVSIESRAACGARAACIVEQLKKSAAHYDAILIAAGGNDVIRGTPPEELERNLSDALHLARERAEVVIVANSANVGGAPMFEWPLNAILSRRSMCARKVFAKVCSRQRVQFVNFTFEPERDPFAHERDRYYSSDGLHPTSAAYAWCFEALLRQSELSRVLGKGTVAGASAPALT